MGNRYIDSMRDALTSYRDTRKKIEAQLEQVKDLYGGEAMQKEQERQQARLDSARKSAERAISDAYNAGVQNVRQWGRLDGSRLTDDAKLLDAGLVDVDTFDELKTRYSDNATMLTALKKYGERMNAAAEQERQKNGEIPLAAPYNVRDIATLPDRLDNWNQAKGSALDILDMLDGKGRYADDWGRSIGKHMSDTAINSFGAGGAF